MTRRTTRRTQWLLLALTLLLLGALLVAERIAEHRRTEAAEGARLQALARTVADNLHQQLQALDNAPVSVRNDFPRIDDASAAAASHRLKVLSDVMPGARTMLVLDAQGKVLAASRAEMLGRDFSERNYFQRPRTRPDPRTLYVSAPSPRRSACTRSTWCAPSSAPAAHSKGR